MLKEKTSDVSMTNTNQGFGTAAEAAVPMSHGLWNTWRKNLLLFCLTGVYVELCLHLCVFGSMDRYAEYPVLFGLLGGALCTLVVSSLPKVLRQITGGSWSRHRCCWPRCSWSITASSEISCPSARSAWAEMWSSISTRSFSMGSVKIC